MNSNQTLCFRLFGRRETRGKQNNKYRKKENKQFISANIYFPEFSRKPNRGNVNG